MKQRGFVVVYLLIGVLILAALVGVYYFTKIKPDQINSFIKECKKAGGGILEIYPPSCQTPDGKIFGFGKKILVETNPSPALKAQEVDETVYIEGTRSADWKIFVNSKYKYQFHYPVTLEQTISECTGPDLTGCLDFYKFLDKNNKIGLEVYMGTWYKDVSLNELKEGGRYYNERYSLIKSTTYNNIPLIIRITKVANSGNGNDTSQPIFDIIADFLSIDRTRQFTLSFSWPAPSITAKPAQEEIQQNLVKFDQILSTFKFTQ